MRVTYKDEISVRVRNAVEALLAEGARVTFYAVAERAEIARSTLYSREDLRATVIAARSGGAVAARATRLEELRQENERLRSELEEACRSVATLEARLGEGCHARPGGVVYVLVSLRGAA